MEQRLNRFWNKLRRSRKTALRLNGGGEGEDEGYKLEDSNMENYGGKEMRDLRKEAAKTEKAFEGAGAGPGLEVWRVENVPGDFGIKRWPENRYGEFYQGDSYIVLNTYVDDEGNKLLYDAHFWLGGESSQDEIGVAAYKTVELDDLLDDAAVQHREVQGNESSLFLSYFKNGITYLMGGIDSGFRKVDRDADFRDWKQLFMFKREVEGAKVATARMFEIPVAAKNMNQGDVFVLDLYKKVYVWTGESASPFEKMEAGLQASNIINSRNGKSKRYQVDSEFWEALGGTAEDVKGATEPYPVDINTHEVLDRSKSVLYRVSDESGQMEFTEEGRGELKISQLDTMDVFLVATNIKLWIWIGNKSNKEEQKKAWSFAYKFLGEHKEMKKLPVVSVKEDSVKHTPVFFDIFV